MGKRAHASQKRELRRVDGVEQRHSVAVLRERVHDAPGELHGVEELDVHQVFELDELLLLLREVLAESSQHIGGRERTAELLEQRRSHRGPVPQRHCPCSRVCLLTSGCWVALYTRIGSDRANPQNTIQYAQNTSSLTRMAVELQADGTCAV